MDFLFNIFLLALFFVIGLVFAVIIALSRAKIAEETAKENELQLTQAFEKIKNLERQVEKLISSEHSNGLKDKPKEKSIEKSKTKSVAEAKKKDVLVSVPISAPVSTKEETSPANTTSAKTSPTEDFLRPPVEKKSETSNFSKTAEKNSLWQHPLWKKIEKQFSENWAGILGSVILVLGISFLGTYASLKVNEFWRFLMLLGVSAGMFGLFIFLRSKNNWLRLALWMRSASAAVFLFACLASGHIPGLLWIHNSLYALLLLAVGVAVNLYLAVLGGKQVFASLHVLLSLLALAVTPQNQITLTLAFIVSSVGVLLTYREKWEYHLLLTITSFFVYHLFWFHTTTKPANIAEQVFPITSLLPFIFTSLIFFIAFAVHYQKLYRKDSFNRGAFLAHSFNWFYFAVSFFYYSNGQSWQSIPLFAVAAFAFFMGEHARRLKIRWLHYTDTIAAQLLFLSAIFVLSKWNISYPLLVTLMLLQTLAFTFVITFAHSLLLFRFGIVLIQMLSIGTLFSFLLEYKNLGIASYNKISVLASVLMVAFLSFHIFLKRRKERAWLFYDSIFSFRLLLRKEFSISAFFVGIFLTIVSMLGYQQIIFYYFAVALLLGFLFFRSRIYSNGFDIGLFIAFAVLHVITWHILSQHHFSPTLSTKEILLRGLPLFLPSLFAFWRDFPFGAKKIFRAKQVAVYIFFLHFIILSYVTLKNISPLLPAVVWLICTLPFLEIARYIDKKYPNSKSIGEPDRHLLHVAYAFLFIFLLRHILVHLQSESYFYFSLLGISFAIKIRLAIELLALAVFFYWAFSKSPSQKKYRSWDFLHPLFVELIGIFLVLTVSFELGKYWHPFAWLSFAFLVFFIGKKYPALSRLKLYAVIFYLMSVFQVTFLLGVYEVLGNHWYQSEEAVGIASIIFQFIFLMVIHKEDIFANILFPPALKFLQNFPQKLKPFRHSILAYPLFVSIALYIYWTFPPSWLTLLWVLECFLVFALGVVLREDHFRYTAMAGIAINLVRLVWVDLANSSTLVSALVFVGVGILMLGMHSLYVIFKKKIEAKEQLPKNSHAAEKQNQ